MKLFFASRRKWIGKTVVRAARMLLAFLLAGAKLFGGYAPFAVGMTGGAGPGWDGLATLVGAVMGTLVFLDFPHALRTAACCVLLFSANNAFCEGKAYRKSWFLPALTAALTVSVELIYILRAGSAAETMNCALTIALASAYAPCARIVLEGSDARRSHPIASLLTLLGVLSALSVPELSGGIAPGRILAVLALLILVFRRERAEALIAALGIGLCVDFAAADAAFSHTACYGFAALLLALFQRDSRVRASIIFPLASALLTLPLGTGEALALLYECLAGTLLFLLVPTELLRGTRENGANAEEGLHRRLLEVAAGLRELYDSVAHTEAQPEENPAVVYDRAAEMVCRDCSLRERCWVNEYNRTYTALSDATPALLRNGEGRGVDFPSYFTDRCIRFSSFLSAVNAELRAYLLRLQYRRRLSESRARSVGQYAQFSALLTQTAEQGVSAASTATMSYRVGLTLRPKGGERHSGDSAAYFETETGQLCLLLSDGMGSGEAAKRESAMAVRLIEHLLRAGVEARSALRILNSALNLRAETSDSFTTIDFFTLSLKNGEGELFKYGAAPTYLKRGQRVRRVNCSCLPAGLAEEDAPPETTRLRLTGDSFLVMVTDGIADETNDAWLQTLLADWSGENPQRLADDILAESEAHKGVEDDAGVLALYLPGIEDGTACEI